MNKKTYLLILILIAATTYLVYRALVPAPSITFNKPPSNAVIPVYQATLSLAPNPVVISPSQIAAPSSVAIVLDSGGQKATAVQVELSYDPKVLTNVDVKAGPFFDNPVELIKKIDTTNGRISYAVGISPAGVEKQGTGTVATITFTANTQIAKVTQIQFQPKTLVTAAGIQTSILKSSTGTSILFQTQPTSILPTK